MDARLIHPQLETSYLKVISTIESCQTKEQLEGASRMVENFKEMYELVGYPKIISYSFVKAIKNKLCQIQ